MSFTYPGSFVPLSQVLKVSASKRTGDKNFITCMRHTLANFYGEDKPVGLGGVFVIQKGKAKIHIMVSKVAK